MRRLRAFVVRLLDPIRRPARERELHDELEAHLQLHIRDNLRAGLSPASTPPRTKRAAGAPAEARRAALLTLGGSP